MRTDMRRYIDEAKGRVSLSEIVGRDVSLSGRKESRCPFETHEDRHPSFRVDDARGRFRCWGCGRGGDHLDWLMAYRKLPFQRNTVFSKKI